jgi:hypothetical protein
VGSRVEFEWRVVPSEVQPSLAVYVIERLVGHDDFNKFGPMPHAVAQSFVVARREFVRRNITHHYQALKLFTQGNHT